MTADGRAAALTAPFRVRRPSLGLGELVDVELQWQLDREAAEAELRRRDAGTRAGIGAGLGAERGAERGAGAPSAGPPDAGAALRVWLNQVYAGRRRPGRVVEQALGVLTRAAAAGGAALGVVATAGLLRLGGGRTVDVASLLGVLVGVQLLVLVFLLTHLPSWRPADDGSVRQTGWLQARLAELVLERARGGASTAGRLRAAGAATPLATPLTWRLLEATQTFGVFFNLGALAALLTLVSFTDLAFSWSTTLDVQAATVTKLTDFLSLPWAWAWPAARPDAGVVAATQLYHLTPQRLDPAVARAWWPFVAAALAVYGLLPRAALLAVSARGWRRTLAAVTFGSADAVAFARRLTPEPSAEAPTVHLPASVSTCGVVLWRDVPGDAEELALLASRSAGLAARWTSRAGGLGGDLDGKASAARLTGTPVGAVVVVVDEFENLDKALQRFLAGVRAAAPALPLLLLPLRAEGASAAAAHVDATGAAATGAAATGVAATGVAATGAAATGAAATGAAATGAAATGAAATGAAATGAASTGAAAAAAPRTTTPIPPSSAAGDPRRLEAWRLAVARLGDRSVGLVGVGPQEPQP